MRALLALILAATSQIAWAGELEELTAHLKLFDRYARVFSAQPSSAQDDAVTIPHRWLDKRTSLLQIASFRSSEVCDEVRSVIRELQAQGAERFVIDVRGNPGGQPMSAACTAALFLGHQKIVGYQAIASTIPDLAQWTDETPAESDSSEIDWLEGASDPTFSAPLVVLADGKTASAAEIFVGALKDNGRATVVGHTTYGKGKKQELRTVKGRPDLLIAFSVEKYVNPSGFSPEGLGIEPTVLPVETEMCMAARRWPAAEEQEGDADVVKALAVLQCAP